jgi:transmembrane sensor
MNDRNASDQDDICGQAIDVVVRAEEGEVTSQDVHTFATRSEEHLAAVLQIAALIRGMKHLRGHTRAAVRAMTAEDFKALGISPFEPEVRPWNRPRILRRLAGLAAAASIVAVLIAGFFLVRTESIVTYATDAGQRWSVPLEDGSRVSLNANTAVIVRMSWRRREVELLRGEATFDVRHEWWRSFMVECRNVAIRSIGTRFDVYRVDDSVHIAVAQGVVEVKTESQRSTGSRELLISRVARVTAGQGVRVSNSGEVLDLPSSSLMNALAWQQGRIIFHNDTLEQIAREFNRYNPNLQLRVKGDAAKQRYSGAFSARSPETFVEMVAADNSLELEPSSQSITIRKREPNK